MDNKDDIIEKAFNESKIRSANGLKFFIKRNFDKDITLLTIKNWLNKNNTIELFKDKKDVNFKIVGDIGSYQMDIMFFDNLKKFNSGYNSLLLCIHIPNRK